MTDAFKPRWFFPTPGRLLAVLLAVEALLWLSERFQWFAWHKSHAVLVAVGSAGAFLVLMLGWFLLALVFKWRFQYSLFSLLALTVAVALPFAWLAAELEAARNQHEAVEGILKIGEHVYYANEADRSPFTDWRDQRPRPPEPAWLCRLLGDDFFLDLKEVTLGGDKVTDALMLRVGRLSRLRELMLAYAAVSDDGLEHFKGLSQLQKLDLIGTPVGDAGLERLKGLTQLRVLNLNGTQVTDAGLKHLKRLTELRQLDLSFTRVGDAGLEHLKGLSQLRELILWKTKVTDAGLERLQGMLQLECLDLTEAKVTDAGLRHLKGLTELRKLHLGCTKVTDAGLAH